MTKHQKISLVSGIVMLVCLFFINPIGINAGNYGSLYLSSAIILFINIGLRLIAASYASFVAGKINRGGTLWFFIGLVIPAFSLIIISFIRPKPELINDLNISTADEDDRIQSK